jgi:two-component system, chemotaxis family, sensor kinase CheA
MKMKFKLGISQRIFLSFSALIALCALLSVFCYNILINAKESSNYISEVADPSLKAMDEFELLIVESKMLTTNWVFLRSKVDDKLALKKLHKEHFPAMKTRLEGLAKQWTNKAMADTLMTTIADFEALVLDQKIVTDKLQTFADYDDPFQKLDAESSLEEVVLPQTAVIIEKLHRIINNQKVQKVNLQNAIDDMSAYMRNLVISVLALFILVSLILGFYMSNIITKPIIAIKDSINALGLGKLVEIDKSPRNDEIGEMINSVNNLVTNLRQTTEFANSIGKGNFDVEHTPLSKHDELGAALIDMKLNLTKFTGEERDRNWTNHGLNEISEILRKNHDSISKLTDNVVAYVIEYTSALQGAFYRLDNKDTTKPQLELLTANSVSFGEVLEEKIGLGQGVIGKVAIEKTQQVINLAPMPQKDGAKPQPRQLVYTPLIFEGELMGVLVLGSAKPFVPLQTSWINHVAEMTASTCDTILRKQTTENLLKEARKLNTELIVKEDALRHANQEMQEKAHELEVQNEAIRTKNESLEIAREAIRVKAEELGRANQYKSEFLANMSHELRTPLNSVIILSNLLSENKGSNLTGKQVEYAKVIQKSGNDLLELINDILDISKIESKHMELDVQDVDIKDWANDIKMLFSEVAVNKGIRFSVVMDKNMPDVIKTDRMRLSQVIKNLLSNAFKFTSAKGAVSLRIAKDVSGNHSIDTLKGKEAICLEVSDNGIGIPLEKQQLIFEPFRQADGSTSRKFGGTGLGLSISKELSALLGGIMTLESTVGEGSTFRLFIPLDVEQLPLNLVQHAALNIPALPTSVDAVAQLSSVPAVVVTEEDKLSGADGSSLNLAAYKILVVDDDMRNIFSLTSILDDYSPKIVIANNGKEALNKLQEHTDVDIVLMDIMMPIMDGYEAMKRIRKDLKLTHLPIISVTANAMVGDDEICKRAGASDYLPKPVSKKVLIECICKWLNLNRAVAV